MLYFLWKNIEQGVCERTGVAVERLGWLGAAGAMLGVG